MFLILSLLLSIWAITVLVISFANILSHSVGCVFSLWMVSFAVQKLKFYEVNLFIFAFDSFALGDRSNKKLLWFMSQSVLPVFFSSYIVSSLTLRSLIYFEFIFVYVVTKCSSFIDFHEAVQFSQHFLVKQETVFSVLSILAFFVID